jgi:hypothetical protein
LDSFNILSEDIIAVYDRNELNGNIYLPKNEAMDLFGVKLIASLYDKPSAPLYSLLVFAGVINCFISNGNLLYASTNLRLL